MAILVIGRMENILHFDFYIFENTAFVRCELKLAKGK